MKTDKRLMRCIEQGASAAVFKSPIPASEFIKRPFYTNLLDNIDAQTTLILGHTRRPTKGSVTNGSNNHPIQAGAVIKRSNPLILTFPLAKQGLLSSFS